MKYKVGLKTITIISRVIEAESKAEAKKQIFALADLQKLNVIEEWAEELVENVSE
jgi:hypothetical protein